MNCLTIRGLMGLVAALALLCASISYQRSMSARARQASLRAQCADNLKQIVMSIEHYVSIHGRYPPGTLPNPALAPVRRPGWGVLIYQLDEEGCSGCPRIDPSMPWDDPSVHAESRYSSGEMGCPSRPRPSQAATAIPATYVGIAGLGVDAPALPVGHPRAGIFGDHRSVSPADVKDGLAYTVMVAESSAPSGPWFAGGRATVRGLDPAVKPYLGVGRPFGGIHGEGANVLMADGSVRWVRPTPTGKGFEAMSTIAGGEVVSDPDDSP
jgi:prepilin-type processing-associated H-X9-DG protein